MKRLALIASGLFLLLSGPAFAEESGKGKSKGDAKKAAPKKPAEAKGPGGGAGGAPAVAVPAAAAPSERARADIKGADGKALGKATLEETPRGVLITVDITGLPAGSHAFHIHETGKCEAPFKTAGGHFNPAAHKHGYKNPEGEHAGDLPNVVVPDSGNLSFQFLASGVTLRSGEKNSILDADGAALVMHKGADDYASDPAGNAGDRIACGVIEKAQAEAAKAADAPKPAEPGKPAK